MCSLAIWAIHTLSINRTTAADIDDVIDVRAVQSLMQNPLRISSTTVTEFEWELKHGKFCKLCIACFNILKYLRMNLRPKFHLHLSFYWLEIARKKYVMKHNLTTFMLLMDFYYATKITFFLHQYAVHPLKIMHSDVTLAYHNYQLGLKHEGIIHQFICYRTCLVRKKI